MQGATAPAGGVGAAPPPTTLLFRQNLGLVCLPGAPYIDMLNGTPHPPGGGRAPLTPIAGCLQIMDVFTLSELAKFNPEKMAKVDLASSPHLISGLNCFEPGQVQKAHAHKGADKLYYVVEGEGEFSVGAEKQTLRAGQVLYVPEDLEHGVVNTSNGRLVVMIVITPNLHG